MPFSFDVYRYIDNRVRQITGSAILPGTATSPSYKVTPGDPLSSTRVNVTFDASGTSVIVKCFEGVHVRSGDRVGLVKVGTDWVCFGSFQTGWVNVAVGEGEFPAGNTSSTTPVNMPGDPFLSFTKHHAETGVLIETFVTSYTTSGQPGAAFSINGIPGEEGTAFTQLSHEFLFNIPNQHLLTYGIVFLPGNTANSKAGPWDYYLQWHNIAPFGSLHVDTWDDVRMIATEVGPEVTIQGLF